MCTNGGAGWGDFSRIVGIVVVFITVLRVVIGFGVCNFSSPLCLRGFTPPSSCSTELDKYTFPLPLYHRIFVAEASLVVLFLFSVSFLSRY